MIAALIKSGMSFKNEVTMPVIITTSNQQLQSDEQIRNALYQQIVVRISPTEP